jgi:hypothetical protein
MNRKIYLVLVFSALFLTMCKSYANQPATYNNGLSCQNYTEHRVFEWRGEEYKYYIREEGADCLYVCSDGTVAQTNISGTDSTLYSSSKEDLDAQFCGAAAAPEPASTNTPESAAPTPTLSPTAAASPTAQASATAEISLTAPEPVLTGRVTMCDTGSYLISFRFVDPLPDLAGKTLTAQIAGQESTCFVNPTNPSLLTCTLPPGVTFPARVVVSLDGAVVNDFTYDGIGCVQLTTPIPTTTP